MSGSEGPTDTAPWLPNHRLEARPSRACAKRRLPLVWDERLPPDEKIEAKSLDLKRGSPVRQLVAASALLHDETWQQAAQSTLVTIRRNGRLGPITDLAEAQLWRMVLLDATGKTKLLTVWQDRVRSIDSIGRHGPKFVLGRCLQKEHLHDQAAVSLLWSALMSPTDKAVAARALLEAAVSLEAAGQTAEAGRIRFELRTRYPRSSAARSLRNE